MEQPALQGIRSIIACTLAGIAMLAGAWMTAGSGESRPSQAEVAAYFDGNVVPLLDEFARRDRAAAERAIAQLHAHFATFHAGVPAFAEDITDWGTRFGVAGRTVKDLWTKLWNDPAQATAAKDFVNTKFRAHIVSEEKLRRTVEDTVAVFRESVAANHNELLASVRLALQMPECPIRIPPVQIDRRLSDATIAAERIAISKGGESIAAGLAGFAGGTLAYEAASRLVAALFARLAAATAAGAAIEGGAVAGSTAAGGATGTLAGPLGTVIGAGVGLAVGFIVDSWMTDSFKASLQKECGAYLDKLEQDLTKGSPEAPGLRKILTDAAAQNHAAFRAALVAEINRTTP